MRNHIINALAIIAVMLLIAGCSSDKITGKAVAEEKTKMSVRLPIPAYDASFTPFVVAQDMGYYSDEGLDVTFNLGNSETNPSKMVSTGADDFGVLGGPDTLLVARSKGLPLVAVAVLHRNSDFPGIVTLKSSGITNVSQLEGKKIGFYYGHISTDVIHSLLRKYNINYTEVDVGTEYSQLIAGKIDAQWVFRTTGILNLEDKGYDINFISPRDYGIDTQGYTIFTTEDMIKEHPEIVEKFLRATFKGVSFSLNNPEEAVKMLVKQDPNLKYELELKRWKEFSAPISNSEEYPIGYMDEQMFNETYQRLGKLGIIKPFDLNKSYTKQFLDEIYGT